MHTFSLQIMLSALHFKWKAEIYHECKKKRHQCYVFLLKICKLYTLKDKNWFKKKELKKLNFQCGIIVLATTLW